ncbi:MAG: hypothetical protein FJW39_35195, partial [Acidobacteria bacterium]|nr:hypothetical protein [Acidobacteriota bacterium]
MSKKNTAPGNVMGLDVGTSRLVVARPGEENSFAFESQLNAFVSVPYSRMTENALKRENVPFHSSGDEIVVHGNEAPRLADLINSETRRPMTQGVLNPAEKDGLPVIRRLIETMTRSEAKPKLCFSVPAAPLGVEGLTYHEATLRQMFQELDYDVRSINEGLAVIYSELEDTNYTGIGISCGGGLCNVCLAYLSLPALSFSIGKAGDFIDHSAASVIGDLANRVRLAKEETFYFNGHFTDKLHQVLTVYYDDVIYSLINAMKETFSNSRRMPKL